MALVKYGGGIIQMSGSIAGDTHARNRYGNYVRARTKPINPNTSRQVAVRASMAVCVERWSETLTAAQRAAWDLYASNVNMLNALGETIHLSGFNHYIRSNASLIRVSRTPVDDGPVVFTIPDHDPAFAITASEATQQISIAFDNTLAWATETDGLLLVLQGQPQNAQRNFFGGPWKGINVVAGIDPGGAVSPDLAVSFYPIAEGQRIWATARIARADGRLSTPFSDDVVVAA